MLLLLLSHFSRVRLCATPQTADHQAPPSLGFSSQEHWSGLPFPSPMHESEKWKWSHSVVSDPQRSHGLQPSRLLHPWDFPGKSTGVGCHRLLLPPPTGNNSAYQGPEKHILIGNRCWRKSFLLSWKRCYYQGLERGEAVSPGVHQAAVVNPSKAGSLHIAVLGLGTSRD